MPPAKTPRRQETPLRATLPLAESRHPALPPLSWCLDPPSLPHGSVRWFRDSPDGSYGGVLAGKKLCEGITLLFVIIGLLTGCTGWQQLPDKVRISPEAQELLDYLAAQNITLNQFKGLGTYRLKRPRGVFSGRMGWACIRPDRFRADIFDFSGRPFATIASDGQWLDARIQGENRVHRRHDTGATIQRIIGTPVPVKEMITFLSGRIPIRAHQQAQVYPDGDRGPVLRLTGKRNRRVEEIHFHKKNRSPGRVVIYSNSNDPSYEVEIGPPINRGGYVFFQTLAFSDNEKNGIEMTIEKLWLVDDLALSIFDLDN